MKQCINILIKSGKIDALRKKYDRLFSKFKTHLTLVYPFEITDQNALSRHIKNSIKSVKPFNATFNVVQKSTNGYIYLMASDAEDNFMKLHNSLTSGILEKVDNPEMQKYIPHISLAVIEPENLQDKAIEEINKINPNYEVHIDSVALLTLNEDLSIKSKKTFKL